MERLTRKDKNGHVYVIGCPLFELPNEANELIQSVADKCNDIEDILGDDYDLDRLRQLVEADRDGRCVVLPVKPGDNVYVLFCCAVVEATIEAVEISAYTTPPIWVRVGTDFTTSQHFRWDLSLNRDFYLTREAAEAALKGGEKNE